MCKNIQKNRKSNGEIDINVIEYMRMSKTNKLGR